MFRRFERDVPIRRKLTIAFGLLVVMVIALAAAQTFVVTSVSNALAKGDTATLQSAQGTFTTMMMIAIGMAIFSIIAALVMRSLIANPYVATVLDMEALAAGKIDQPILRANHNDCVGRLSRAMISFRDAAVAQRALSEQLRVQSNEQNDVVEILASALNRLADGDILHTIDAVLPEQYERLRQDFNRAKQSLGKTLGAVANTAQGISTGSGEISAAADDLSLRTEQQAASLQETVGAMNAVTAGVKQTASRAETAATSVDSARNDANEGGVVVRDAIEAMGRIEKSSQEISQIVSVMDAIAFQTNLLALNAGVEAARAGDSGRGFAVVANEVRALAQRSANAAKDITALISESSRHVGSGVGLVQRTGDVLSRIVDSVGVISKLVTEISAATQTQATSLQQVNTAVSDMDQMTQQNAAMVEQSTAAARSLTNEAQHLTALVVNFKLPDGGVVQPRRNDARPPVRASADAVRPKRRASRGSLALVQADDQQWNEF